MPRNLNLEFATARLKLSVREEAALASPQRRTEPRLSPQRNRRHIVGPRRQWAWRRMGEEDRNLRRFESANGKAILNFSQAVERSARPRARPPAADNADQSLTLKGALSAYQADLKARGASPYNARWPGLYLPAALLARPVRVARRQQLRRWRDSLQAAHAPATVNRSAKSGRRCA